MKFPAFFHPQLVAIVASMGFLSAFSAQAAIIWTDNFSRADAASPNPYDFSNGAVGNDYSGTLTATGISSAISNETLVVTDTSATNFYSARVASSQWAPYSLGVGSQIQYSVDFRVDSLNVSALNAGSPRLTLTGNGPNPGQVQLLSIGLARGSLSDGDGNEDLFLYAITNNVAAAVAPNQASALGLNVGSGWATGFNFGDYDNTTFTNNNTDAAFYRLSVTATQTTADLLDFSGTVTNLSTLDSLAFTRSIAGTGSNFNQTDNTGLNLNTGGGAQAVVAWDNLSIAVIPEPSICAAAFGLGVLALVAYRHKLHNGTFRKH